MDCGVLLRQTTVINFRPFHLLCSVLVAVTGVVQRRLCSAPGTLRDEDENHEEVEEENVLLSNGLEEV